MKELSKLMDYRKEIKVLDVTLRDGGLVNDFYFSDELVKALYQANIKAGVDYMEFGYKASTEMFDIDKFGKWKFCKDEDIRAIVGENDTDMKISIMNYKRFAETAQAEHSARRTADRHKPPIYHIMWILRIFRADVLPENIR